MHWAHSVVPTLHTGASTDITRQTVQRRNGKSHTCQKVHSASSSAVCERQKHSHEVGAAAMALAHERSTTVQAQAQHVQTAVRGTRVV
jgi:hypothetical protein